MTLYDCQDALDTAFYLKKLRGVASCLGTDVQYVPTRPIPAGEMGEYELAIPAAYVRERIQEKIADAERRLRDYGIKLEEEQ
jgi:hypothetical protein